MKIKVSRSLWNYIGYKVGWKTSILSKAIAKSQSFIKTAAVGLVSNEDVAKAFSDNFNMAGYDKSYILRAKQGGDEDRMEPDIARQKILDAFMAIYNRDSSFAAQVNAYVSNKRAFALGAFVSVESGDKYLVPTFNNLGLSNLKSVFTGSIDAAVDVPKKAIDYSLGNQGLRAITTMSDVVKMMNRAGFIVKNATVEIGTIGSRSTNWDTSYNLNIKGATVPNLLGALTNFTSIENTDVRNQSANTEYNLTMSKEVNALMSRLGLGDVFNNTVKAIKKFEFDKNLKAIYDRQGRIPNYKTKTKIEKIPLVSYETDVFTFLLGKVTSDFASIFVENNVSDPQELLSVAFSMGSDGTLMNDQDVSDLIEAAA